MLTASSVNSQSLSRADIIGSWLVDASGLLANPLELDSLEKKKLEDMNRAFLSAEFVFYNDSSFQIIFKKDTPEIMLDIVEHTHYQWKFDERRARISFGSIENNYNFIPINIHLVKDRTIFVLEETPFKLVMTKKQSVANKR